MARPANPIKIVDLLTSSTKFNGGADFVTRLVHGWHDEMFDFLHDKALRLDELIHPFRLQEIQGSDGKTTLDYFLWNVGITDELDGLRRILTSRQKRLLAAIAPGFWQRKGLSQAWGRAMLALTGVPSWYESWFDARTLTDTLGDGWGDGTLATDAPFESSLWARDPDNATTRNVIAQLVELGRPVDERVRVRWLDMLELFESFRQPAWVANGPISFADGLAILEANTLALWQEEGLAFHDYVLQGRFSFEAGAVEIDILVHWAGVATYYAVVLNLTTAPQTAQMIRRLAGPPIAVATVPLPWPLLPGIEYRFQVTVSAVPATAPAQQRVELRLDGEAILSGQDVGSPAGCPGFISVGAGTGAMMLHHPLWAYDLPLEHAWVAPPGATDDEA